MEPGPFGEWLEWRGWSEMKTFDLDDLEEAFDAGEQTGFERATEYYGRGGSFK